MTHPRPAISLLKNIAIIAILSAAVFWLGHESGERGVFMLQRPQQIGSQETASKQAEAPANLPEPTLPTDFPQVTDGDLVEPDVGFLSLKEAYSRCWKKSAESFADITADIAAEIPADGEITTLEAEALFGKIKRREILEKSNGAVKVGLLFDNTVFPAGGAGAATETEGRFHQFRLRAAGRMLHCESPNRCECL